MLDDGTLAPRVADALRAVLPGVELVPAGLGAWLPADELAEARIVGAWLAGHEAPALELDPRPDADRIAAFVRG